MGRVWGGRGIPAEGRATRSSLIPPGYERILPALRVRAPEKRRVDGAWQGGGRIVGRREGGERGRARPRAEIALPHPRDAKRCGVADRGRDDVLLAARGGCRGAEGCSAVGICLRLVGAAGLSRALPSAPGRHRPSSGYSRMLPGITGLPRRKSAVSISFFPSGMSRWMCRMPLPQATERTLPCSGSTVPAWQSLESAE